MAAVISLGLLGYSPGLSRAATLQQLLRQQSELQEQAEASRKKAGEKAREAANLQEVITNLDEDIGEAEGQIVSAQAQINLTNQVIGELAARIAEQQTRLAEFQDRLRNAYISLYELSQTSPLEIVLQSNSVNELVSHTQYIQAIQSQLQQDINAVNSLLDDLGAKKSETEKQKANLDKLNKDLTLARNRLNSQKNQKGRLLTQTQGEQTKYEELVKLLESQKEVVGNEIYELRRARTAEGKEKYQDGGTGGYPYANADPNKWDSRLFYYRQCTSYASWKFLSVYGLVFDNTRPGQGSAWNWPALAADQDYQTSSTPRADSIVSWPRGWFSPAYGHAAWVEKVNDDGTINVSEYNFRVPLGYGERQNVNPLDYGDPTYIYP